MLFEHWPNDGPVSRLGKGVCAHIQLIQWAGSTPIMWRGTWDVSNCRVERNEMLQYKTDVPITSYVTPDQYWCNLNSALLEHVSLSNVAILTLLFLALKRFPFIILTVVFKVIDSIFSTVNLWSDLRVKCHLVAQARDGFFFVAADWLFWLEEWWFNAIGRKVGWCH